MKNNSEREEDKLPSDELTKTPLVNFSYAYELWNELTKLQRSNNNNNKLTLSRRREITKTLLDIYSSPKARLVAAQIWDLKAFTTEELMKLTGFSDRVIDHTRKNLIRIGLLRSTLEINSPSGKRGPKPHVYAIGIADTNDSIEAKLRYNELMKQKLEEDKALKKESRRLAIEEIRRRAEAKDRLMDTKLQTLVTEFTGFYEKTKKPVSLQEIDKKTREVGISDHNAFLDVAVRLEEQGIQTCSYLNGKPDPKWKPPPQIRKVREIREEGF